MTPGTEPTTEAGRALAEALGPGDTVGGEAVRVILAIEAEARADALREVAERVRGLPSLTRVSTIPPEHHLVQRSMVLAILDPAALRSPDTETADISATTGCPCDTCERLRIRALAENR